MKCLNVELHVYNLGPKIYNRYYNETHIHRMFENTREVIYEIYITS